MTVSELKMALDKVEDEAMEIVFLDCGGFIVRVDDAYVSDDEGFHLMMSSSLEYENLKRQGKKIPEELNQRMKQWSKWIDNLSQEEYDRLIH